MDSRGAGNTEFKQHMQDSIDSKTDNYWWVAWSNERAVHIIKGMEKDTGQRELSRKHAQSWIDRTAPR